MTSRKARSPAQSFAHFMLVESATDGARSMRTAMKILPSLAMAVTASLIFGLARADDPRAGTFRLWGFSDAHVVTDKANGRDSLATALQQSEGASGFDWDIALDLGDM